MIFIGTAVCLPMSSRCHSQQEFLGESGSHWRVIKASAVVLPCIGVQIGD